MQILNQCSRLPHLLALSNEKAGCSAGHLQCGYIAVHSQTQTLFLKKKNKKTANQVVCRHCYSQAQVATRQFPNIETASSECAGIRPGRRSSTRKPEWLMCVLPSQPASLGRFRTSPPPPPAGWNEDRDRRHFPPSTPRNVGVWVAN